MAIINSKCDECGTTFSFGHTLVVGSTSSSKATYDALARIGRKSNAKAIKAAQQKNAPYYRQFDKRR
ncbi:hypothetical protein [Paraburkholderia tropica]|uniref:hypothetical protein n=1 Tax=Paraburkholderia tropica TaxID=92647 RepID=UPI002AB64D3D|nr:hypothetical protein [Paraburkholderia tropica]